MATLQPKASLFADPVPFNCLSQPASQPNETRQATPSSTVTQTATVDEGTKLNNNKMNNFDREVFFTIKPTRRTNFTNLFCHETLHVSDSSLPIIRSLFTVHSTMVYVIQVCRHLSSRTRMELSSFLVLLESCYKADIYHC